MLDNLRFIGFFALCMSPVLVVIVLANLLDRRRSGCTVFEWFRRRRLPAWSCGVYARHADGTVLFGSLGFRARDDREAADFAVRILKRSYPESEGWTDHNANATRIKIIRVK